VRPLFPRPAWKVSMSSTKVYISQFRTASRSIYLYVCVFVCIKICADVRSTGCGVVYLPVNMNVCTYILRTDLYVEGPAVLNLCCWSFGMLHCAVESFAVNYCSSPPPDIQCVTSTAPLSPCFVCSVSVAHTGCDLSQLRRSNGDAAMLRISH